MTRIRRYNKVLTTPIELNIKTIVVKLFKPKLFSRESKVKLYIEYYIRLILTYECEA